MKEDFTGSILNHWQTRVKSSLPAIRVFLKRFASSLPAHRKLAAAHEEVFGRFDCLRCASCCRNSSPVFNRTDISRIASFLGMKAGELEKQYLKADADGDFVPQSRPCPFIEPDNRCRVYEARPKSCRGFPHTDNPEAWERHQRMAGNAAACPAAFAIVEKFRQAGR